MKNLALNLLAIFLTFTINLSAGTSSDSATSTACTWKAWFKYPQNDGSYEEGKDVYVRVDPQKYQDIEYMELYINGKLVRKESTYPFEWCKGSGNTDGYLRKMKKGAYKLKCKIKDKCGQYHEIYCTIDIKGNEHNGNHPGNAECSYKAWFKYPQNGQNYNSGSNVHVYVDAQQYHYINYVELYLNDKLIRKESNYPYEWCKGSGNTDGYLRHLKPGTYKLKARVYDKCGKYKDYYCTFYVKEGDQGNDDQACKYKSWYKYPQNNGTYKYGDDVYVRVDTEKYQDIAEMELYVNGKFVRKEATYPYEWCKGSGNTDSYLRNLKRGTYNLKARVKTKCGEWHEYFCKVYVK
ncbi:MAG: Ig-like domain-containing protein [Saprospiraceae bacterium]|nr:hypothetical protein [Lewinella sp.]